MFRWSVLLVFFALLVSGPSRAEAKIYVWVDEDNRTHYCNDVDDVPEKYRENMRTIESRASSTSAKEVTAVPKENPRKTPPPAEDAAPSPLVDKGLSPPMEGVVDTELAEIMNAYHTKRQELRQFRKSGRDIRSEEYEELKRQLLEIKDSIREARKQSRLKSQ